MKRYSIRTLLLVTLLIAVFVARPLQRAKMQRHAREWVSTQRGHCLFKYGYGRESDWYETESDLKIPAFFVRTFGIDVFNPVEGVIFDCDELVTLEPLKDMVSLRRIVVNIEMAEDIDFMPLTDISSLQSVHFTEWAFLNESQLSHLRVLLPDVEIISDAHANHETSKP